MASIVNAVPKFILEGIQDLSGRTVPREREQYPIHLPQFFSFAEKGPKTTQLVSGSDGNDIYGYKTFDASSEYATHVTSYCNVVSAQGNSFMFKRLVPDDAVKSTLVLWLTLTPTTFPISRTTPTTDDGPVVDPDPDIAGFTVKWEIREASSQIPGGETKNDNEYPILEFHASSEGLYGDNLAFSLSVPTTDSLTPPDLELIAKDQVMVLRIMMLSRQDALSSPTVIQTLNGTQSVDFVLKPGVVDKYNVEKYIDRAVVPSYEDLDTPGFPPVYAPMDVVHLYRDNHLEVIQKVYDAELAISGILTSYGDYDITTLDKEEMNYFTGVTVDNKPFRTLDMESDRNGVVLSELANHYLEGGGDGDISNENLNKLLSAVMEHGWDDPDDPLSDMALNPFSCIWDSGFEMDTKKMLCEALGRRKDVAVILSAHVDGDDVLNWEEEESVVNVLRGYAANYPESVIHGTPVCRALAVAGSGFMVDGSRTERLPLSIDLADKIAAFMGAGSGVMADGRGFDIFPNNQVTILRDVSNSYKTDRQRQRDWDAGMVWAQSFNRRSVFYPAVQTVYLDDTSILNSAINMFIAAELEKVCAEVWKNLTGNAKLTSEQFIERSNDLITNLTSNRFDGRVIIVPETFYTAADTARGYSWSCRINMYGNNMKTVGTFTVVARRMEDLAA